MHTYGLIGHPLGHSFSRAFFTKKFQEEGIQAEYLNFDIATLETLKDILDAHPQLKGFNVTLPYKQAIIPLLDGVSEEARAIGAVNVVRVSHTPQGIRLKGFNSDTIGFSNSISPLLKPHHDKALVLGTGGASKAVCHSLDKLGIGWKYVSRKPMPGAYTYEALTPEIMAAHTVIVNCSPVGMYPHTGACPQIPYEALTPRHLLYDLVYNPVTTLFMKRGEEHGAVTKNGLEMLHLQALASWDFWHSEEEVSR